MDRLKKIALILMLLLFTTAFFSCASIIGEVPQESVQTADLQEEVFGSVGQPAASAQPSPSQTPEPEKEPELLVTSNYTIERLDRPKETPMGEKDTWTVFIYMCGTDLESKEKQATANLNEMFNVKFSDKVNVVIQTGGTKEWHTEGIRADKLQRFRMEDGGLTLLEELPQGNMGAADTLYDFLSWGVARCPAEKMALLFWNHGGGSLVGTQYDQNYGRDALTLPEMKQALERVYPEMTDRFELVGFDTCLMATLEVANILADHARYLVASEEAEPAGGWDYRAWLQYLCNTPRATGADLGRAICDGYFDKCRDTDMSELVTLSVTDLSKIDTVLYAFNNVARELYKSIDDSTGFAQAARGANKAESYGGNSEREGFTNLVDAGDMVRNVSQSVPDEAEVLMQALEQAVIYDVQGKNRSYATGLSVYYPLMAQRVDRAAYEEIAATPDYFEYVDKLVENKIALMESREDRIYLEQPPYINDQGYYEMQVKPSSMQIVQGITFDLYYDAGGVLHYLGSDSDVQVDWATGYISDNFAGKWALLDGQPVAMYMLEETGEYNLYTIPVLLNGRETNLRVIWTHVGDDGYFEIIGAWDGIDEYTGMAAREVKKLKTGDTVIPLYHTHDPKTGAETGQVQGQAVLITSGSALLQAMLPQGEYLYGFAVEDIYGGKYETELVEFGIGSDGSLVIG
ncbi:clostripain-related cysteine peptidase [Christensenellaceae bacterium OttesenSCG-928-K19]|nr:clostripain-related cysteine peptidase [Christensenellaceae bacterium OttesenSCG-928-K19]